MSKEDKPLPYERRILDTKGIAQRVDLDYLKRPVRFRDLRRKLTRLAPVVAVALVIPLWIGRDGGEKIFSNGAVSRSHAVFESNCRACHTALFSSVPDAACRNCHDGPSHPAKPVGAAKLLLEVRCAQCHLEHQGRTLLTEVRDGNCTLCHADLVRHATGVTLEARQVRAFRPGGHPEFSAARGADTRPIKLNHAVHMPAQPKTIRAMKLPMKCGDCHVTDTASPNGDLRPVTFQEHCLSCHKRELEFDVYQILGDAAGPAPHTKDPETIHAFIAEVYQNALTANPLLLNRPLGRDLQPLTNASLWLDRVVRESEAFLFERKCNYCHEYEGHIAGYPMVKKINPIRGRFIAGGDRAEPWLPRAEFSHRAHRAVECAGCHAVAVSSTKSADVLIPRMQDCLACHGSSGTHLDQCSQCHLYHNKSKELDKDRRPVEQLIGWADKGAR